ncbi:MAG: hypothetical protein M1836_005274 [Candelina mexicana]|nr:MAG: hypothetical protein M1836_005274 [Candelina mexicana]
MTNNSQAVEDSVKLGWLLNKCSPTLVAAWDLKPPSQRNEGQEKSRTPVLRYTKESSGANDHRRRVHPNDVAPGAICKVEMAYINNPGKEWIGTAFLITNDIAVTAGHNAYSPESGPLEYIRVFAGYAGERVKGGSGSKTCSERYGSVVAMPAEYMRAESATHDVAFIIKSVDPMPYKDTPRCTGAKLRIGVVGYPGDLDNGEYMYEDWHDTSFDLLHDGLLNYRVDTGKGQSGAPVLQAWSRINEPVDLASIGVHVRGGNPKNVASVIGPYGNIFEDYLTAFEAKGSPETFKLSSLKSVRAFKTVRGFELISVPAGGLREGADNYFALNGHSKIGVPAGGLREDGDNYFAMNGYSHDATSDSETDDSDRKESSDLEHQTMLNGGVSLAHQQRSNHRAAVAKKHAKQQQEREQTFNVIHDLENVLRPASGSTKPWEDRGSRARLRTRFPKVLPKNIWKEAGPMDAETQGEMLDKAVAKARFAPDVTTCFFVNLAPELEGKALENLRAVKENLEMWQTWASSLCETKVQEMIEVGQLSSETGFDKEVQRSNYRAMVFDFLMKGTSWFAKTQGTNQEKSISCKKFEFHNELVQAVLEGFLIPQSVFAQFERVLSIMNNDIAKLTSDKQSQNFQYWIMLTRYDYQPIVKTVKPVIRVISFETSAKLNDYSLHKATYQEVKMDFKFHQYECEFNDRIFAKLAPSMDRKLVDTGKVLIENMGNAFNFPVPKGL